MLKDFKRGIPLLENELIESGISKEQIDFLVLEGKLKKYDKIEEIYYINNPTYFEGLTFDTTLSIDSVIEKLYIGDSNEYGMYYNLTLLNKYGGCNQVPYIIEIITTKVEKVEELVIDDRKFILYPYKEIYNLSNVDKLLVIFDVIFNKYVDYLDIPVSELYQRITSYYNLSDESVNQYRNYIKDFEEVTKGVV